MEQNELADRYLAVWNEPDATKRRASVEELWTADGLHIVQPTEDVLKEASGLGFTVTFEAQGHEELATRIRLAYEEFVAGGGCTFKRVGTAMRLRDMVKIDWALVDADGTASAAGTGVLLLDDTGRIRRDYQFIA
ncbi:hypothetical protein [Labedaea rhizosphaerae]|uniref:SnoaL-like protein n=1 Tax=Labedaea rhizosphaerae TaxID=598644 RepID=A0A4R6RQK3_LABRH|nr:hypothetical protein [Labedaea rhizosphaerae]TDP88972.1 hypothetical protein EV186_11616 [Labedaea rhizosphaerae]